MNVQIRQITNASVYRASIKQVIASTVLMAFCSTASAAIDKVKDNGHTYNNSSCGRWLLIQGGEGIDLRAEGAWLDHTYDIVSPRGGVTDTIHKKGAILPNSAYIEFSIKASSNAPTGDHDIRLYRYKYSLNGRTTVYDQFPAKVSPPSRITALETTTPNSYFTSLTFRVRGQRLPSNLQLVGTDLISNQSVKSDGSSGGSISGTNLVYVSNTEARLTVNFAGPMKKVRLETEFRGSSCHSNFSFEDGGYKRAVTVEADIPSDKNYVNSIDPDPYQSTTPTYTVGNTGRMIVNFQRNMASSDDRKLYYRFTSGAITKLDESSFNIAPGINYTYASTGNNALALDFKVKTCPSKDLGRTYSVTLETWRYDTSKIGLPERFTKSFNVSCPAPIRRF